MIPRATYRVQLNKSFTFRDATAIVPYLSELGISHVYCSPYFKARAGSLHGYDVVDHNQLNPEIGDRADFDEFVAALRAHDMGHILDIVPNHVGIMGADNEWWMDVLEHGQHSRYADFFDIEWHPANPALQGKILVPVLGDPYGEVLERGELELRFECDRGSFAVFYHEHRLPIDPRTYALILEALPPGSGSALPELAAEFGTLGGHSSAERACELKQRLKALCTGDAAVSDLIESATRAFAGSAGDPRSFDRLHALLELQSYRLASWRVAPDEINYRRFFDVNDLAALRVEIPEVFEHTHRLLLELIRAGRIDGLRVDHPDGLRDPEGYFRRLQSRIAEVRPHSEAVLPIYLIVEKITASFERLPETWPVHGETGYHFANVVNRMLVDAATRGRMDRVYQSFIEQTLDWPTVVYEAQHMILRRSLASELSVVANQLTRIAQADRRTRDLTFNTLRQTLAEVIACFPVYRTYVGARVSEFDKRYVDWAIAAARRRRTAGEGPAFDFVRAALLLELPVASEELRGRVREFAEKFQQVTAPVTAKGVEDTSLYRFNRLTSLNEVGGEPDGYGSGVRTFHADSRHRARFWPHEMLATSTHDTKRSEDVRARINVLSEMTQLWRKAITRWARLNRLRKREVEAREAPSLNDEYLLYQTLIGTWPAGALEEREMAAYRERIEAYMVKATREAKSRTSWTNVNAEYEDALVQFIRALLEMRDSNPFLTDFVPFQRRIGRFGMLNSLSQVLCKLTAPGVPDIYQGNETADFSLVDPDNRRPVDYAGRRAALRELSAGGVDTGFLSSLVANLEDGRAKFFLTWKVLQFRKTQPALFRDGEYLPLRVTGTHAGNVCAFARRHRETVAITIAPRLYLRLLADSTEPPLGAAVWKDTVIELPKGLREHTLTSILDERPLKRAATTRASIRLSEALLRFPVALIQARPV